MRLEQLDLQRVVHDELEAMTRGFGQLLGAEHAFEQHDGRADARARSARPSSSRATAKLSASASASAVGTSPCP